MKRLPILASTGFLITALAVLVAGCGSGSSSSAHQDSLTFAPRIANANAPLVSSNWSGYAALAPEGTPLTFTDATGGWVQPKARCVRGRSDAAAFWVGLGGFDEDSTALEQLGTTAQCNTRGVASYFAWWELVPAPAVRVSMKVRPGDRLTAAVLVKGQIVTMSLKDVTRRTRFSKTLTVSGPLDLSSAEWIAEAPSICTDAGSCEVVPLTNFGSVKFSAAALTGNQLTGTITDPAWLATPIQLITDAAAGGPGAVPGALSTNGRSFTVAYRHQLSLPGR
jgi:Peptidase A4 family